MAVLVSSHVLSELEEMSDRAVVVRDGTTVSASELDDAADRELRYRIAGPENAQGAALTRALEERGIPYTHGRGRQRAGVVVAVSGRQAAAQLLAELVGAGVPIAHFAEEGSRLEDAYLAAERPAAQGSSGAGTAAGPAANAAPQEGDSA